MPRSFAASFAVLLVCLLRVACEVRAASVNFERDVRPILITHCFACHGQWHRNGDLDLRSVELMRRGGRSGPVLLSNNMQKSRLLRRLLDDEMPPLDEPQLSEQQLETIQQWILAGAPANDPSAVYGAEFYQTWGISLVVLGITHLIVIVMASARRHSTGYHVMFAGLLPLLLVGLSSLVWYPPNWLTQTACLALILGMGVGGGMVSKQAGREFWLGFGLAGFLSIPGLVLLARLTHPASAPSQLADESH